MSKFLAKAPDIQDLEIRSRLNKLREKDECVNKGNDNSNNNNSNNIFLPPPPYPPPPRPPTYFPPPFKPPTLSDFFLDNEAQNFSQQPSYVSPPPPPPSPLPPVLSLRLKRQSDVGRNTTQTLSGDHLIGKLERITEKEKSKQNLVSDEDSVFTLLKIRTILDNDNFETKKEIKEQEDEEINDEIDLQMLHDKINSEHTPSEVEFYFEGPNRNFFLICSGLNLNRDDSDFIEFLSSDIISQIFRKNMLSIHIESGNNFI